MPKISVVIPLFNESTLISELVHRVKSNLELISLDYEIILVDDGSSDQTWKIIKEIAKDFINVKAIRFSRNFGHHFAITAGLQATSGDWVVVMDGDLQDRPEVIPKLYEKALQGFDIVFVSRQNRSENLRYKIAQKTFYLILNLLSGVKFDSRQANFSIINSKVVEAFNSFPENARFYGSTIKWLGFKRASLSADHGTRYSGTSSYTIKKRLKLATDVILSFSDRPLKLAIGVGFFLSLVALVMVLFLIFAALKWGYSVVGWPSLMVAIFFFSGVILMFLGLMGMYMGRIFSEVKNRPLFIISETINEQES
jgi:dolichol-phosphate mannosyltransferase